jgi:hypothetical protein
MSRGLTANSSKLLSMHAHMHVVLRSASVFITTHMPARTNLVLGLETCNCFIIIVIIIVVVVTPTTDIIIRKLTR